MQRDPAGIIYPHTVEVPHDLTCLELLGLLGKNGSAQAVLREEQHHSHELSHEKSIWELPCGKVLPDQWQHS